MLVFTKLLILSAMILLVIGAIVYLAGYGMSGSASLSYYMSKSQASRYRRRVSQLRAEWAYNAEIPRDIHDRNMPHIPGMRSGERKAKAQPEIPPPQVQQAAALVGYAVAKPFQRLVLSPPSLSSHSPLCRSCSCKHCHRSFCLS